ncbi:MAG: acetylornithine/succinyldiaminopimelate transaminase [SAR86 cluster bacterium]|uniref:Acetylornithine/succinyldiaminopimelate transaminase n=1 Tax=SAR86 cluster bacterium TaxID=2030880 RepID=A0A838XTS9_9GAMM|nr:acetylornithine/succinyldiaminopimelate transaminase [SAR86 cluster bacterium]
MPIMVTRTDFNRYMMPTYNPASFIPSKAKGSLVWDKKNKKYIDFASGIAVSSLGHCHPELNKALVDQSKKMWHLSNVLMNEPAIRLAKIFCKNTFAEKVFFANSGAEAVEGAIKTARKYAYENISKKKNGIVSFSDAFHGRTMMAIALNGSERFVKGFGPMPGGIKNHPFNETKNLEKAITKNTAAVIIELVQGEAGIIKAKKDFIQKIKKLCKENKVLIIVDEVQSGAGRTGTLFAYEQFGIKPDIMCCAKGIGGGIPIAAVLTTTKIAKSMEIGSHGTTFGGNPLACAVAEKVMTLLTKKMLLNGVKKKEKIFLRELQSINKDHNCFSAIRSSGLWIGCKLNVTENFNLDTVMKACYENGLMILKANDNTIRIAPSLIIEDSLILKGLKILRAVIQEQHP